jgi:phosphoserine phosphatase
MSTTILIHAAHLSESQQQHLETTLDGEAIPCGGHFRIQAGRALDTRGLEALREEAALDINILPPGFDPAVVRLLITDMDSTLINIECVDEIADFVGVKPQVSAITEAAMRGEINFETSLRQRVALLEGLDVSALERVYHERLQLNPGAEALLAGLRDRGVKVALVSGGFTFFTHRLQARLGLDFTLANELRVKENKLQGAVEGSIVGAEAKAHYLMELCQELGIEPSQAIAMGDGANDLKMLGLAGLGVAYHAKPTVRTQTHVAINQGGLDTVLDFLWRESES